MRAKLEELPFGIGSGFQNPAVTGRHFVFCMRMGDTGQVWFRNVLVDANWEPAADEEGRVVIDDTLVSLVTADPGSVERTRSLPDQAFRAAYEAWAVAQSDAHEEWMRSTDPNALAAEVPASFRDAKAVILNHGGSLGSGQASIVRRLNTVPTAKARKAMRAALQHAGTQSETIGAIVRVLDDFGIQPAEVVKPLAPIVLSDVRLIAWMAVEGTKKTAVVVE